MFHVFLHDTEPKENDLWCLLRLLQKYICLTLKNTTICQNRIISVLTRIGFSYLKNGFTCHVLVLARWSLATLPGKWARWSPTPSDRCWGLKANVTATLPWYLQSVKTQETLANSFTHPSKRIRLQEKRAKEGSYWHVTYFLNRYFIKASPSWEI